MPISTKELKKPEIINNLPDHPKICQEIGNFIVAYAALEIVLWKLYAKILEHPDEIPTIDLLGGINSFVHRAEAIKRVLENINDKNMPLYIEAIDQALAINSFRVELVHGVYVKDEDGSLWLCSHLTDPRRTKTKATPLSEEVIKEMVSKTRKLAIETFKQFSGGETQIMFEKK